MSFRVTIYGEWELDERQIWPDDDGPENPSTEDVIEVVRAYMPAVDLITDWNLPPSVEVDGVDVERRGR